MGKGAHVLGNYGNMGVNIDFFFVIDSPTKKPLFYTFVI